MQTLKTSVVVTFMLVVLYGAYVALNAPQPMIPDELQKLTDVESVDIDMGIDIPALEPPPAPQLKNTNPPLIANNGAATHNSSPSFGPTGTTASLTDAPDNSLARLPMPDPSLSGSVPDPKSAYPQTSAANVRVPDPVSVSLDGDSDTGLEMPGYQLSADKTSSNKSSGGNTSGDNGIANAMETANRQVAEGRLREALFTLSIFYGSPDLSAGEQKQLLDMLDPLAGEVIYSPGHFIEPAHKVVRGETLNSIATEHSVPEQLLANINQVSNPDVLLPGTELKVMKGPFRAEVSLARSEITLFLGDLYAGRFPMTTGQSPRPSEGTFTVLDKQPGHEHVTADGRLIPKGSPENPFGDVWIDLGKQLVIHGSPSSGMAADGCIRMSPVDARDIFIILAQGSPVTVRR